MQKALAVSGRSQALILSRRFSYSKVIQGPDHVVVLGGEFGGSELHHTVFEMPYNQKSNS